MIHRENINQIWASLLVEECTRNGVDTFFLSPGARCTPLTLAVARHPDVRTVQHFDERGLAFAALGYARATGRPGVLITTSGTAVTNLHPAVVEAAMDHQPMLLLTADRPPELRDTGANQSIQQTRHFGEALRWFFDLPCPDGAISPAFPLTTLDHALHRSRTGPVQLNCMFREPLGPTPDRIDSDAYLAPLHSWQQHQEPYTAYYTPPRLPDDLGGVEIEALFTDATKAVIVAGGGLTESETLAITRLAETRGWPVISDITSGLHFGHERPHVIRHVDALVYADGFPEMLLPDAVLQFGSRFLSKSLLSALESLGCPWIQVTDREGRFDPSHRVTHRFCVTADRFCPYLEIATPPSSSLEWTRKWLEADEEVESIYQEILDDAERLSEPGIARALTRTAPNLHGIVLGASMPVRDASQFAAPVPRHLHVIANRGASGIDGTLATAAGFARGLQQPVTVLLGDLTALHDLNSLALIAAERVPVIAIIVNNHGGGIFHFLPLAEKNPDFEQFWGTPHPYDFRKAAEQFRLSYDNPSTMPEFVHVYEDMLARKQRGIIELRTDRQQNREHHRALAEMLELPTKKQAPE